MPLSAMVSGAGGFIGRRVVERLLAAGHTVHGVDMATGSYAAAADVEWHVGDVGDEPFLSDAIRSTEPDVILHLAGMMGPETGPYARRSHRVNVESTVIALDGAQAVGVPRFVFSSSIAVYGSPQDVGDSEVSEETPCRPRILYGAQKLYCEHLLGAYRQHHGLEGVAVRIATVFGHGRRTGFGRMHGDLISRPAIGEPVKIPVPADQRWAFVSVHDVAALLVRAATGEAPPSSVYNTGGTSRSMSQMAESIRNLIPEADIQFDPDSDPYRSVNQVSSARAAEELGFVRTDICQSIAEHIDEARTEANERATDGAT